MTNTLGNGRYAPSPSGDLHLGNLRTALLAWAAARQSGRGFVMRVEDLDRVKAGAAKRQLQDLAALGLDWDGPVVFQSSRLRAYEDALATLDQQGRVFECYCSRKDILSAPSAPHAAPGAYPGTCRELSESTRRLARERLAEQGRHPALRLRADIDRWTVSDYYAGEYTGSVDDFVLRRGDGTIAYNLAVVVDDTHQQVSQICRADDLLSSAPRQAYLGHLLGYPQALYMHVPLVLGPAGKRLAKRDGAVTLRQIAALLRSEQTPLEISQDDNLARDQAQAFEIDDEIRELFFTIVATSLGVASSQLSCAADLLQLDLSAISRKPWVFDPDSLVF